MKLQLESMAIDIPRVKNHPNREPFRGVLTSVDVPSNRPPAGARGHRVLLTRTAAERGLASLLGMALDYAPALDRHDTQRKVGLITRADIVGNRLELGGYLFGKDFPDLVTAIRGKAQSGRGSLGMSYEISDVRVADMHAKVWTLTEVMFTGAAILERDKAAYEDTWIEIATSQ